MKYLNIIVIILIAILLIIGIETFIKLKKSENKTIDEVRKPLLIRINILMIVTVMLSIASIICVILKK